MRKLKRLLISLTAAALVTGNVAALTTFTARAEEDSQSADEQSAVDVHVQKDGADSQQSDDAECAPIVTPVPQQIVTAGGAALEGAKAQAVLDFLATLEVAEDFAVYADTFQSGCDHVEGNIAVNHLESDNFLVKVETPEGMEGGEYSYIGEASGLVGSKGTVVLHGDADLEGSINDEEISNPAAGTQNADETILVDVSSVINLTDGTVDVNELASVLESVEQFDADVNEIADTIQINENLNRIADAADAMDRALQDTKVNETTAEAGMPVDSAACEAVNTVTGMLADNTLRKGDVVVIDISVAALTQCAHAENSLQGSLKELYRANTAVGATLLVRVNTEGTDTISITVPMYQEEHGTANGYLIWDFGAFSGTINANSCVTAGVIVAPNAEQVVVTGIMEGRVITNTYTREGSSETHQPWMTEEDPTPTPTNTPTPTPEEEEPTPTPEEEEPTPTPEEEEEPTPTPEEEEEPTPTPEEEEEPTPTPDEEEEPTPTPEEEEPTPTPEEEEPTPTPEEEEPTPTPEEEEEPTPTPEEEEPTPTPEEEEEPTPTPEEEEEPTPTPEEEDPTPTVTITDTPTPTSATPTPTTTVTITDGPVPLADTPEEGEVLGARRTPAVPEQGEVLGERRAPQTGDTAKANLWLAVLFGAAAGLGTWAFQKKRDEKRLQA